ncbi:NmrA family NAD(P)-binding protein [Saccharopolyspora erythraea]|uniref:NmrA family NAD(P)-binding protein n=1 Tax=Saccharopolyspora erythraea TaxID=1836 RepID=UPI001BA4E066|nr:NmrA family NAD(P)-binding protein [Saccharopolyspora erythraea]QUH05371.1 NmrA family NAD(P)-binding protein [Saccharopolyspora erythraea]
MRILITGGTGNTGRPLAAALRARGADIRVASRHPRSAADHVRFDWADPATHGPALEGVEVAYLVPPLATLEPMPLVEPFLAAASGVRRVVLLGSLAVLPGAPGIVELERAVQRMPESSILRPSGFMQNFLGAHPVATGIRERGEIVSASGPGRLGWIDAEDIAAVAAEVLTGPAPAREHTLTGPETLSYSAAAAIITEVTGRPVRYTEVSVDEQTRRLSAFLPQPYSRALAAVDADIRRGSEDRTTSVVEDLTGRPPRSFRDFVAAHMA